MINTLLKSGVIAFLVIGSGFLLVSSVLAETESENSSETLSEPIRNEVPQSQNLTESKPGNSVEPLRETKKKEPEIGDIIEVNPSSQNWDLIHSGDLNRGTIKFRF